MHAAILSSNHNPGNGGTTILFPAGELEPLEAEEEESDVGEAEAEEEEGKEAVDADVDAIAAALAGKLEL